MAFTLVQTMTDKGSELGSVTSITDRTMFQSQDVEDRTANIISAWTDKGVSAFQNGMPIGLLLVLTYTL